MNFVKTFLLTVIVLIIYVSSNSEQYFVHLISINSNGKILGKVAYIDPLRIHQVSVSLEGANRTTYVNEEGVFVL